MEKKTAIILMVLTAALSRLIPHPWNFTAIGATALFSGASFQNKKDSLLVPIAALFLSDLILGLHSTMLFTYLPFVITVFLGWTLRQQKSASKTASMAFISSALFFLVSNFGVWLTGGLYPLTGAGLFASFVAGIPFYANQILGDLFFTAVLFGSFEYAQSRGLIFSTSKG